MKNDILLTCAKLSHAVYSATVPDDLGVVAYEKLFDPETNTFGMAYITKDQVFIVFRGSQTKQHWLNNFKIIKTEHFGIEAHKGFAEAACSVLEQVMKVIAALPDHEVVLSGHSLGGAIAVLVAVALRPEPLKVITFGQPRVCAGRELNLALYGEYIRVVNGSDIVPRKPWLGYSHCGTCVYLTNDGRRLTDPNEFAMFMDRCFTLKQRGFDHMGSDYIRELGQCV